jgi:hypothetical protein
MQKSERVNREGKKHKGRKAVQTPALLSIRPNVAGIDLGGQCLTGETGMAIVRALSAGERDPCQACRAAPWAAQENAAGIC